MRRSIRYEIFGSAVGILLAFAVTDAFAAAGDKPKMSGDVEITDHDSKVFRPGPTYEN